MAAKNLVYVGALALVMQSAVFAEDLSEAILAMRAADFDRLEQLMQAKKYSKAEYDTLITEADQIVAYNDANFNKSTEGIYMLGGISLSVALTAFNIYKIATASDDNERLIAIISTVLAGLLFLGIDAWSIHRFRKNCSNSEKALKITELLHAAKARSK